MTTRITVVLTCILLWLYPAAVSSQESGNNAFLEACVDLTDDELKEFISSTTEQNLRQVFTDTDFRPLVRQGWLAVDGDRRYESIVDTYVQRKLDDRESIGDFVETFFDGYRPEKAELLAEQLVKDIFASPEFAHLTEDVGGYVSEQLKSSKISADVSARNQAEVAQCLRSFLADRYTEAIAEFADAAVPSLPLKPGDLGTSLKVSLSFATIAAGIILVLARRIIGKIVAKLVLRIGSALALRVAAWATGIGGILIVGYDLVTGAAGPYLIIQEELKSQQSRDAIIISIAEAIPEEGAKIISSQAEVITAQVYRALQDFRQNYRLMLELTETSPAFRDYVGQLSGQEDVEHLSRAIAMLQEQGGSEAVMDAFDRARLQKFMRLSNEGKQIAYDLKSVDEALKWSEVASNRLNRVVEAELHRSIAPDQLPEDILARLLSLDDTAAITNLGQLDAGDLQTLLELASGPVQQLSLLGTPAELQTVAKTLRDLDDSDARFAFIRMLLANPPASFTDVADSPTLLAGIVRSDDQELAISMTESHGVMRLLPHFLQVADGAVSPRVFLTAYPWAWVPLLIAGAALLRIIFWLLPRRRSRKETV